MRPPDLLTMSATELDRLSVIERVRDRRLSRVDAAKLLGLTLRHISRLVDAFERDGPVALVSKRRGREQLRQQLPGQGARRTDEQDAAGPVDEGAAAGAH
jgi:CRP-like cAMP-binding protein